MIQKCTDLKIEQKMIHLCDINDKTTNLTITQSRIIRALAPTIAGKVFSKQFYYALMATLEEELLTQDDIDDANRIQHVLMAYAEIIANIPVRDYVQTYD